LAPNARGLSKDDFEMYVVRVNVFENEENAKALKKNINNYFPAYIEALPNNDVLTAVYVGPFRTKEDIEKNIAFIYEISETDSGEVVLWKP
jgi:cell division septation protein DedD